MSEDRNLLLERMHATKDALLELIWDRGWEARFRAWILEQGLPEVVGIAVANGSCPLAHYVEDRLGLTPGNVQVSPSDVRVMEGEGNDSRCVADIRLSPTAQRFVMRVDANRTEGDPVLGGAALYALAVAEANTRE